MFILFVLGKLFAIVSGLYYWGKLPKSYKLAFWVTVMGLVCETIGYYIVKVLHQYNVWIFNIYIPLEFMLFCLAFSYESTNAKFKKAIPFIMGAYAITWIALIYKNTMFVFSHYAMLCSCVILPALYLALLLENIFDNDESLTKTPIFWLCTAIIVCFAGNIPYMAMFEYWIMKYLTSSHVSLLLNFNQLLDAIRYPLIGISFLLLGYQKQPKSPHVR
jgi:hypothetical protein